MIKIFAKLIFVFIFLMSCKEVLALSSLSTVENFDAPVEREFSIPIYIKSDKSINAFSSKIIIPKDIEFIDAVDGGSIISSWIKKPDFDKSKNEINFSGIIPGGFKGEGLIFNLILKAKNEGNLSIYSSSTIVYLNTSSGISDTTEEFIFKINSSYLNPYSVTESIDSDSPEAFSIYLTRDNLIYENKWVILFNTQDKISGIDHYEISEVRSKEISDPETLSWRLVESPVLLKDQELKSYIYVKAVDKNKNEKVVVMSPQKSLVWYNYLNVWILVGVIVILITSGFYLKRKIVLYGKKN